MKNERRLKEGGADASAKQRGRLPSEMPEGILSNGSNGNGTNGNGFANGKKYLGILETYGVSWTLEKVARDTLQNFFDSNGQTLEGIGIEASQRKDDNYAVRIEGNAAYDHRYLMHLGATSKSDDEFSAGGFGEGAKVMALVLLRDYGFSQVRFGSRDWVMEYYLDKLPEGEYVDDTRGLHAELKRVAEPIEGSFVEFVTGNGAHAQEFAKAKDLFYHPDNYDFRKPLLDIPGVGGFNFVPSTERYKTLGNFYHVGQRRHYEKEEWGTVQHFNLWTWQKLLEKKDRDRGIVTHSEVKNQVIPTIIKAASTEQLIKVVRSTKSVWSNLEYFQASYDILEAAAKRLASEKVTLKFDGKYLASVGCLSWHMTGALQEAGYKLCPSFFSDIGMASASEKYRELQKHSRIASNSREMKLMGILQETVKLMGSENREIWLFDREKEKSVSLGQDNGTFVWLAREVMQMSYYDAMSVYLHELDHRHGHDGQREFSDSLTKTMAQITKLALIYTKECNELKDRWNSINGITEEKRETTEQAKKNVIERIISWFKTG